MPPKKILIAEDEKPMANALNLKLRSAGYETTLVYDGEATIAAVQASPFDLILLDLVMPKKDGFAVLAARIGDGAVGETGCHTPGHHVARRHEWF